MVNILKAASQLNFQFPRLLIIFLYWKTFAFHAVLFSLAVAERCFADCSKPLGSSESGRRVQLAQAHRASGFGPKRVWGFASVSAPWLPLSFARTRVPRDSPTRPLTVAAAPQATSKVLRSPSDSITIQSYRLRLLILYFNV